MNTRKALIVFALVAISLAAALAIVSVPARAQDTHETVTIGPVTETSGTITTGDPIEWILPADGDVDIYSTVVNGTWSIHVQRGSVERDFTMSEDKDGLDMVIGYELSIANLQAGDVFTLMPLVGDEPAEIKINGRTHTYTPYEVEMATIGVTQPILDTADPATGNVVLFASRAGHVTVRDSSGTVINNIEDIAMAPAASSAAQAYLPISVNFLPLNATVTVEFPVEPLEVSTSTPPARSGSGTGTPPPATSTPLPPPPGPTTTPVAPSGGAPGGSAPVVSAPECVTGNTVGYGVTIGQEYLLLSENPDDTMTVRFPDSSTRTISERYFGLPHGCMSAVGETSTYTLVRYVASATDGNSLGRDTEYFENAFSGLGDSVTVSIEPGHFYVAVATDIGGLRGVFAICGPASPPERYETIYEGRIWQAVDGTQSNQIITDAMNVAAETAYHQGEAGHYVYTNCPGY